jgi:hypothetical protein
MRARHLPFLRSLSAPSNQLEFLAKFQAFRALEIDREVGLGRITVGARAPLRGKVHAILTRKTQLEVRRFLAQS